MKLLSQPIRLNIIWSFTGLPLWPHLLPFSETIPSFPSRRTGTAVVWTRKARAHLWLLHSLYCLSVMAFPWISTWLTHTEVFPDQPIQKTLKNLPSLFKLLAYFILLHSMYSHLTCLVICSWPISSNRKQAVCLFYLPDNLKQLHAFYSQLPGNH